jgi:hypothetical protein
VWEMGESIWKSVITYPNTDTTIIISIILFTLEMKIAKKKFNYMESRNDRRVKVKSCWQLGRGGMYTWIPTVI